MLQCLAVKVIWHFESPAAISEKYILMYSNYTNTFPIPEYPPLE